MSDRLLLNRFVSFATVQPAIGSAVWTEGSRPGPKFRFFWRTTAAAGSLPGSLNLNLSGEHRTERVLRTLARFCIGPMARTFYRLPFDVPGNPTSEGLVSGGNSRARFEMTARTALGPCRRLPAPANQELRLRERGRVFLGCLQTRPVCPDVGCIGECRVRGRGAPALPVEGGGGL